MLGSAEEWFYRRLGGMDIDLSRENEDERLTVRPIAVNGVDWVRCGYDSALGKVESDWKRANGNVLYTVTVPKEATVVLPAGAIAESKRAVSLRSHENEAAFRVGAGTWNFSVASN